MGHVASNKKVKKLTRMRQRATGERYTVALAHVRRQETTMSKDETKSIDTGETSDFTGRLVPIPLLPARIEHGKIGIITKNPVIKLEPGETYTLLTDGVLWAAKTKVVALTLQSIGGVVADPTALVSNLRVVRAGDGAEGSGDDLLSSEHNPAIPKSWRDGRRYDAVGDPWTPLLDYPVLGPSDRLRLDVRCMGSEPVFVAVSVVVGIKELSPEYQADLEIKNRALEAALEPEEDPFMRRVYDDPWMRQLTPDGRIRMWPMHKDDVQKQFCVRGGEAAIGIGTTLSWRPSKPCALHGLLFQAVESPTGVVVVLRNLRVFQRGKPRTPTLLANNEDFDLAEDHSALSVRSSLAGNPILVPGDEVRVEVAAFAPEGEEAVGRISVLTHMNFSQADLSALFDHLARMNQGQ